VFEYVEHSISPKPMAQQGMVRVSDNYIAVSNNSANTYVGEVFVSSNDNPRLAGHTIIKEPESSRGARHYFGCDLDICESKLLIGARGSAGDVGRVFLCDIDGQNMVEVPLPVGVYLAGSAVALNTNTIVVEDRYGISVFDYDQNNVITNPRRILLSYLNSSSANVVAINDKYIAVTCNYQVKRCYVIDYVTDPLVLTVKHTLNLDARYSNGSGFVTMNNTHLFFTGTASGKQCIAGFDISSDDETLWDDTNILISSGVYGSIKPNALRCSESVLMTVGEHSLILMNLDGSLQKTIYVGNYFGSNTYGGIDVADNGFFMGIGYYQAPMCFGKVGAKIPGYSVNVGNVTNGEVPTTAFRVAEKIFYNGIQALPVGNVYSYISADSELETISRLQDISITPSDRIVTKVEMGCKGNKLLELAFKTSAEI